MIPVVLGLGSNNDFNGLKPLELLAQGCQKLQNFFTIILFHPEKITGLTQAQIYLVCRRCRSIRGRNRI